MGATTTFNYDRDRLLSSATGGVSSSYDDDPFGRLDTVTAAGQVIERVPEHAAAGLTARRADPAGMGGEHRPRAHHGHGLTPETADLLERHAYEVRSDLKATTGVVE